MDQKLTEITSRALSALKEARSPYAIGGAIALRAHGIIRETTDLDVFLQGDYVHPIFKAFRRSGFEVVQWAPPDHFAAILPKFHKYLPNYRIDLMVTVIPSDISAIESPVRVQIVGKTAKIFPAIQLAASKFLVGDPKNIQDVLNIISHGLASPLEIRNELESVTYSDAAEFTRWWKTTKKELVIAALERMRRRRQKR